LNITIGPCLCGVPTNALEPEYVWDAPLLGEQIGDMPVELSEG
jgi:hypothetical protein